MATPEKNIKTKDLMIHMGPQHPSTHGVLHLVLEIDVNYFLGSAAKPTNTLCVAKG